MDTKKVLVGLVGISGVGKSSIAATLRDRYGFTWLSSYTTRPRRGDDFPGEYTYVTDDEYDSLERVDRFLETARHGSHRYAVARPDRKGPYVTPINAHGLRFLDGNRDEHGLSLVAVGIIPPDEATIEARNSHLGTKQWAQRKARDHHFGYDEPPPLLGVSYSIIVPNTTVVDVARCIFHYVRILSC